MKRCMPLVALLVLFAGARGSAAPVQGAAMVEAIASDVAERLWVVSDLHWHKGEYCHIVNLTRMVVAARPTFVVAYSDAAWLLWSMDRDDEAVALFDQGIAANPDSYLLYADKGFYYINRRKDWKTGLGVLEKAVAQKDCAKIVFHTLAHAYERSGDLDNALKTWIRAADDPDNPGRAAAKVNRDRVQRLINERK